MLRSLAGQLLSQAARQAWRAGHATASPKLPASGFPSHHLQLWELPAAFMHRAGLRTRHKAHGTHHRSIVRRVFTAAGKVTALAMVGVPLAGIGVLVYLGRDEAEAAEVVRSLPRTARVVWWGARTAYQYKAVATQYASDPGSTAHQQAQQALEERAAQSLLLAIQANGGLYIKAGQLAVSLNAIPATYRKVLESLQDRVPPRPFADAARVLLQELGAPPEDLFAEFEGHATAAASLAQVHRARMKDGTPVAVKVQYPGLQSMVEADLATMLVLADAAHWLFPDTSWRWLFEELQRQLQYELDFRNEATNAARLAACMAGRRDVAVPSTFPDLCTRRVLTMEWVEGCKVTDVDCLSAHGFRPREVGLLLLDAFAQQTYYDGFTHGDPHPGNILVRARQDKPSWPSRLLLGAAPRPQLILLDHGVYVTMPDQLRRLYCQLWCSIVLGDMDTARAVATQLAGERGGRILPEVLRPRNWAKLSKEERQRVRQDAGITSFSDLAAVLTEAPRPLLDSLRQSAVVRHSATALGATLADRLRINATWALRGMYRGAQTGAGGQPLVGHLQSRFTRWHLVVRVGLLRLASWLIVVVQDLTAVVLPPLAA